MSNIVELRRRSPIYILYLSKKKLQKKSLSAVFFLKAMNQVLSDRPFILEADTLDGSRGQRSDREMAVLIKVPSFFFPMHSDQVTAKPEPSFTGAS